MKIKKDIMNHKALIERIKLLDVETIEKMSPEVIARLTAGFDESLVRKMLYITERNYEQRELIKHIKGAYKSWKKDTNILWGGIPQLESYPEYMDELQTDIECGLVITEKGIFEEDPGRARLKISLITSDAVPLKAIKKGIQSVLSTNEEKHVADNDNLKSITEGEFNAIFSDSDTTSKEEKGKKEETAERPQALEGESLQTKKDIQESNHQELSTSDTAQLQVRIKELQDALNEEKAKNAKLEEEIATLCEPIKELTATQNIRLAFALQLFRAAGLADFNSLKANRQLTKVARLLSLLTDIRSTNIKNGPAHTCMKWLTFREYVTSTNTEQIININKLLAELDLSIALSLENPAV